MEIVWYLDRATALIAYPALYVAVLTGVFYNTSAFGMLHQVARRIHIEVSVFATLMMLAHGIIGVVDAWFVVSGQVPPPDYPMSYFIVGVVVGGTGLLVIIVAVLGFVDPRRFERPWGPRTVHAFAYGGFAFATIHTAAIGTDIGSLVRLVMLAGVGLLVYVLVLCGLVKIGLFDLSNSDQTETDETGSVRA